MPTFKRKVLYIRGFGRRRVRRYPALLVGQMRHQADGTGTPVTVSPQRTVTVQHSDWTAQDADGAAVVENSFLRWEDIVFRGARNPATLICRSVATYRRIMQRTDLLRARPLGPGPRVTLVYPPIPIIVLPLLPALLAGTFASLIFAAYLPWILAGGAAGLLIARPTPRQIHSPWLLRFFFNDDLARGKPPPVLGHRLRGFADKIANGMAGSDEVLLLAHGNGAVLSMPVMDDLLARCGGRALDNPVFVTLRHCSPLIGCRSDTKTFLGGAKAAGANRFSLDRHRPAARWCRVFRRRSAVDLPSVGSPAGRSSVTAFPSASRRRDVSQRMVAQVRHPFRLSATGGHPSPIDLSNLMPARRVMGKSLCPADGAEWERRRTMIDPGFTHVALATAFPS